MNNFDFDDDLPFSPAYENEDEKKENENNYEKIFLSFIHCPDTIEQYKQDFLFFKDSIMKKGKLDEKDIKTMKAYQTFLI